MKKILLLAVVSYSLVYGGCSASTNCETPLFEMSQDVQGYIDNSFSNLDKEIDATKEEYLNLIKELDKEIYALKIRLGAEKLLFEKLSSIEKIVSKTVEIKDIDTSVLYNILEKNNIKKDKK